MESGGFQITQDDSRRLFGESDAGITVAVILDNQSLRCGFDLGPACIEPADVLDSLFVGTDPSAQIGEFIAGMRNPAPAVGTWRFKVRLQRCIIEAQLGQSLSVAFAVKSVDQLHPLAPGLIRLHPGLDCLNGVVIVGEDAALELIFQPRSLALVVPSQGILLDPLEHVIA